MRCIRARPCGSTWLLPLRMTVYIRFKPSPALPASREMKSINSPGPASQIGMDLLPHCMYPGTIGMPRLPLEHGVFAYDEILSSCRRGTCSC